MGVLVSSWVVVVDQGIDGVRTHAPGIGERGGRKNPAGPAAGRNTSR
jgi:hypothetical protein